MKIPPREIEQFLESGKFKNYKILVLYGPDLGQVNLYANKISKIILGQTPDPFSLNKLSYKDISKDTADFNDELFAMNLMASTKLFIIDDVSPSINKDLKEVLSQKDITNYVVIKAGELSPSSSLRQFAEKSDNIACIAFYKEEAKDLKTYINSYLRENNFSISPQALEIISNSFYGDRMIVKSELDKIIIYMLNHKEKHIDETVVSLCIAKNQELTLNKIDQAVASRNIQSSQSLIRQAFEENINPITILRALTLYFNKIRIVKYAIISGMPMSLAFKELKHPIFFKDQPIFEQHVKNWNIPAIHKILTTCEKIEIDCKQHGKESETILLNALVYFCIMK